MPLSQDASNQIKAILDGSTDRNGQAKVPGLAFSAIDKSGKYLVEHESGTLGSESKTPVDRHSIFWLASCTKMVTGIAAMQLVEQGKIGLDNAEDLYKVCPELKDKKVLLENGEYEDKKGEITLRLLLTHTAGFGYDFLNPKLKQHAPFDGLASDSKAYMGAPLVNHPDEYFKKNIFEPLGIKEITFLPTDSMKERQVQSHQREGDGSIKQHKRHIHPRPLELGSDDSKDLFHPGGAGCYGSASEYCLIIAALLNDGTSPNTGAKILDKATVDEMFKNSIPSMPDFARQGLAPATPELANPSPEMYPQTGNPPQGWGLTFFLTMAPGDTGRGANTGWWAGLANLFWWADREKGVGGMIAGQVLPFGDMGVLGAWFGVEKALYDGLS